MYIANPSHFWRIASHTFWNRFKILAPFQLNAKVSYEKNYLPPKKSLREFFIICHNCMHNISYLMWKYFWQQLQLHIKNYLLLLWKIKIINLLTGMLLFICDILNTFFLLLMSRKIYSSCAILKIIIFDRLKQWLQCK